MTNNNDYSTFFQTPVEVANYMASLIPEGVKTILEPTPGIGNIVRACKDYQITAPEDYFLINKKQKFDCIVGNPPFSAKYAILENADRDFTKHGMRLGYYILTECMDMSDNIIMLMPWFTISDSDVRLRFIKNYGLKAITALPRKTFEYARIQTVILELNRGWKGQTIFKTFDFISQKKRVQDISNCQTLF